MAMDIRHLTGRMDPLQGLGNRPNEARESHQQGERFSDVLRRVAGEKIHFSGHASQRLESRNIALDAQDIERLGEAVDRAAMKGSTDSLILDGDQAYVVNVPNRTVITAMDQLDMRERVFTKIDSAVFTRML